MCWGSATTVSGVETEEARDVPGEMTLGYPAITSLPVRWHTRVEDSLAADGLTERLWAPSSEKERDGYVRLRGGPHRRTAVRTNERWGTSEVNTFFFPEAHTKEHTHTPEVVELALRVPRWK